MSRKLSRWVSQPFTVVVGTVLSGDPSRNGPNPNATLLRKTHRFGWVRTKEGYAPAGISPGARTAGSSTLVVEDNDFSTGYVTLILGQHRLQSVHDFAIGVDADATAANIAASINRLGGYTASSVAEEVTILSSAIGEVDFRVESTGTIENFSLTPSTGLLASASPSLGGPELA